MSSKLLPSLREPLGRRSISDIDFDPERTYIGRLGGGPRPWGNPFVIGRDGTREEVIEKYRGRWADRFDRKLALAELQGQILVCHCSLDEPCHGDVLLELMND